MSFPTHPADTDLFLPLPGEGDEWDPHTVHTYAALLSVPEPGLSVFTYIRCQPAFPLSQGGICIFRGLDNVDILDMDYCDYLDTMPWPAFENNRVTTYNGFSVEILDPGRRLRLTYTSPDGSTSLDVEQTALTPLLARGHVVPGEEHHDAGKEQVGGSEQMMHSVGELVVGGERHDVDCIDARDRSWGQVRTEMRDAVISPPALWTPVWYDDLGFNQVGYEGPDTEPYWEGLFDVPADRPTHHYAWAFVDGEMREISHVRLNVLERHPMLHMASKFEIDAEDATGRSYHFAAQAVSMTALPTWHNSSLRQAMYRWQDEQGRIAHNSGQEIWFDQTFQHAMKRR